MFIFYKLISSFWVFAFASQANPAQMCHSATVFAIEAMSSRGCSLHSHNVERLWTWRDFIRVGVIMLHRTTNLPAWPYVTVFLCHDFCIGLETAWLSSFSCTLGVLRTRTVLGRRVFVCGPTTWNALSTQPPTATCVCQKLSTRSPNDWRRRAYFFGERFLNALDDIRL